MGCAILNDHRQQIEWICERLPEGDEDGFYTNLGTMKEGGEIVTSLRPIAVAGDGGDATWIEVRWSDGHKVLINGARIHSIGYAPQAEEPA